MTLLNDIHPELLKKMEALRMENFYVTAVEFGFSIAPPACHLFRPLQSVINSFNEKFDGRIQSQFFAKQPQKWDYIATRKTVKRHRSKGRTFSLEVLSYNIKNICFNFD